MYITPPIQFPLSSEFRTSNTAGASKVTFKGLPKFEPDVFELRPDFNCTQDQTIGLKTAGYRPSGGLDYRA